MTEERALETLDTNEPRLAGSGAMGRALDQGTHREAAVARAAMVAVTGGGGSGAGDGGSGLGTAKERLCRRDCAGWAKPGLDYWRSRARLGERRRNEFVWPSPFV